ncbi:MAG: transcriptional repressor [Saprospirales bacterium]|nr:MAG: transcriptional repressor [Saprospirales bacterium]
MHSKEILKNHGIRLTEVRQKVLQLFLESPEALSNEDIEKSVKNLDRITLYRTLKTFEEKGIIHKIPNSGNSPMYAVCQDNCTEHHHLDSHGHFHCLDCGKTVCMDHTDVPTIIVPKGYTVEQKHLILEGKCDACS